MLPDMMCATVDFAGTYFGKAWHSPPSDDHINTGSATSGSLWRSGDSSVVRVPDS